MHILYRGAVTPSSHPAQAENARLPDLQPYKPTPTGGSPGTSRPEWK